MKIGATAGPLLTGVVLATALLPPAAGQGPTKAPKKVPPLPEPRFVEASATLGIDFLHRHFGTGEKYMPENMGPGLAIFDTDGDGRLDIYLVQGALIGPPAERKSRPAAGAANRLFRQRRDGTFDDATAQAGVGDRGYGMGASYGDVDGDGDLDLYVTNFGPNVLYRNRGDGTFEDSTAGAGVADPLWGVSSGFFDADGDGDLDLYVVNYVDFAFDNHKFCGNAQKKVRSYCHPDLYQALPDVFYRNEGGGKFTMAGKLAGILPHPGGKGLGVGFGDLDGDGDQDIYVANDSTMNFLYLGDGRGKFEEGALLAGVGVNATGAAEAGMGVQIGDLDGDGLDDLFVTNLDRETNTFYRGLGDGLFEDATEAIGLASPSLPWVGFGTVLFDHDNDGDLDVFVTNGHILDNIELFDPGGAHRQPSQLFDNRGESRLVEVTESLGLDEPLVGRGAAAGDLDRDGDLDLVLTQNGGRALVLLNRVGSRGASLAIRLVGKKSQRQGLGARLELQTLGEAGRRQVREVRSASGYLSQGAPEVYFGLGPPEEAGETGNLAVHWPSGQVDHHPGLKAGFLYTLTEGSKEVEREAFGPPQP